MNKHLPFFLLTLFLVMNASSLAQPELDVTFNSSGKYYVSDSVAAGASDVLVQSDNKIILVSACGSIVFGPAPFCALRINQNGSVDTTFVNGPTPGYLFMRPNGSGEGASVTGAVQSDGKLVLAGYGKYTTFDEDALLMRFESNGSLDMSFGTDGIVKFDVSGGNHDRITGIEMQDDGKIVAVGYTETTSGSNYSRFTARFLSNGTSDSSFGTGGVVTTVLSKLDNWGESVAIQDDGKILVGGTLATRSGAPTPSASYLVSRLNSDGSPDTSWNGDGTKTVEYGQIGFPGAGFQSLAIQTDGRVVALGHTNMVYRFNTDGSIDTSFDQDGSRPGLPTSLNDVKVFDLAISASGRITVVGHSKPPPSFDYEYTVSRYMPDGSPDPNFGQNGYLGIDVAGSRRDSAGAVVIDGLGRTVLAGMSAIGTVQSPFENSKFSAARLVSENAPFRTEFDFDGDRKSDISIFRPSVGEWWYRRSSNGIAPAYQFGSATDIPVPADFSGDVKTDIAFFRPGSAEWFVLNSDGSGFYSFPFGATGDIPAPGDFDGDGKADPAVYRPSTSTWFILRSSDSQTQFINFGIAEDKPVVGDYDNDGKDDVAIYRPSVSQFWILRSTAGLAAYQFGTVGDKAMTADFSGDGSDDIAVFRPSTGFWFILRSEDDGFYGFPFGANGDLPAPGDYDGDGTADPTVFRPSTNTWFSLQSTAGTQITSFGASGDAPVPGVYVTN